MVLRQGRAARTGLDRGSAWGSSCWSRPARLPSGDISMLLLAVLLGSGQLATAAPVAAPESPPSELTVDWQAAPALGVAVAPQFGWVVPAIR